LSELLINQFLAELDRVKKFSGSVSESTVREAFKDLLKAWSRQKNLHFIAELPLESNQKTRVIPDGTILHDLRVPLGYWEAKDPGDDLDEEIRKKFARGYPQDNIVFEDSQKAVLIQNRQEVLRATMTDVAELDRLLTRFFAYERPEIEDFRKAVQQFKTDLPAVLDALRERIDAAYKGNSEFQGAAEAFLAQAKQTINPSISDPDVREMLIQHILTEEIFSHVFNDGEFHRENNIAKALYGLESKFFTGAVKRETLRGLQPYYAAINANAALITSHHEKQTFLKVIYENFYKVYNQKAADRLGVVYTPNEIVRFMIEGADWLTQKHFKRSLIDRDVQILDPATGTGTFICELMEHFRGQPEKLAHKYKHELHANEVAILPYYVANLNIEATYAAISGQFAEYPSLCFVDTLDNVAALGIYSGHQHDLFGAMSDENIARVKRQNEKTISVIIGNPPYNANQQNENDNNKNREYARIDQRIKDTYIRQSTAQKTKLYDMYARFFRWASDRLNKDGVLAFITNRSFIDSRTFDGFRKAVAKDFADIYVVDLGGDVRANPRLSGTKHNVFGIQTGVAISFMVKRAGAKDCRIHYARRPEFDTAEDKLAWLGSHQLSALSFERIEPDKRGGWLNLTDNDWEDLVPLADKKTKIAKSKGQERAVFRLFSFGLVTNRDDWIYARDDGSLNEKVSYLIKKYNAEVTGENFGDVNNIKWTRSIRQQLKKGGRINFERGLLRECLYRPFDKQKLFYLPNIIEMLNQTRTMFGSSGNLYNKFIAYSDATSQKPFMVMGGDCPFDMHLVGAASGAMGLPRYRYTSEGERLDNIADWGLRQFEAKYGKGAVTKDDIFAYCYGVLHDPVYREKYALNLKRDFPRVPLYDDFRAWRDWGQKLLDLHIGYEGVALFQISRADTPDEKARAAGVSPRVVLKSDPEAGIVTLDSETKLTGIPSQAWDYRLGNRSAIDWVLDQHKEKTPKDPTIREKFNTYRFADYKEKVVDLLARVVTVSVETVAITDAMRALPRT
jgi:predicted helicase